VRRGDVFAHRLLAISLCLSPPTAWQVSGFVGAREERGSVLAAVFFGIFTPGSALLHPGLRSDTPLGFMFWGFASLVALGE
jgi:hypothetical protein